MSIEDALHSRHRLAHLTTRSLVVIVRPVGVDTKHRWVEHRACRISAEGIVYSDVELLLDQPHRAASCTVRVQSAQRVVPELRGRQAHLEGYDVFNVLPARNCTLRMSRGSVDGLAHQAVVQ